MDRREAILEELLMIKGMIAEVQAKCKLWKIRAAEEQARQVSVGEPVEPTAEFQEGVEAAAFQMNRDLAKYCRRIRELSEELRQYGEVY